jgi:hypothetical protein
MTRGRPFDADAFAAFRAATLPAFAAARAAAGDVASLWVLLQRHPAALGRRLLPLLSTLPEALDPKAYASLLPHAATAAPPGLAIPGPATALSSVPGAGAAPEAAGPPTGSGGRRSDWVEAPEAWRELEAAAAAAAEEEGSGSTVHGEAEGQEEEEVAAEESSGSGAREGPREAAARLMQATEDMERFGLAAAAAAAATGAMPRAHQLQREEGEEEGREAWPRGGGGASIWPAPSEVAAWWPARALQLGSAPSEARLRHALCLLALAVERGANASSTSAVQLPAPAKGGGGACCKEDGGAPAAVATMAALSLAQLRELAAVLEAAAGSWQEQPAGTGAQPGQQGLAAEEEAASDPPLSGAKENGGARVRRLRRRLQPPPAPVEVGLAAFVGMPLGCQLRVVLWGRGPCTLERDVRQR